MPATCIQFDAAHGVGPPTCGTKVLDLGTVAGVGANDPLLGGGDIEAVVGGLAGNTVFIAIAGGDAQVGKLVPGNGAGEVDAIEALRFPRPGQRIVGTRNGGRTGEAQVLFGQVEILGVAGEEGAGVAARRRHRSH